MQVTKYFAHFTVKVNCSLYNSFQILLGLLTQCILSSHQPSFPLFQHLSYICVYIYIYIYIWSIQGSTSFPSPVQSFIASCNVYQGEYWAGTVGTTNRITVGDAGSMLTLNASGPQFDAWPWQLGQVHWWPKWDHQGGAESMCETVVFVRE